MSNERPATGSCSPGEKRQKVIRSASRVSRDERKREKCVSCNE